jgi:hypothetical protein
MRRHARLWLPTAALAIAAAGSLGWRQAAADGPPSAIGDQAVQWLAVSPAYSRTGLVVALAAPLHGCSQNCLHLWVTHNGGSTWSEAAGRGWAGGRPVIGVDGSGRDVLVAASGSTLQLSTDSGGSWVDAASNGTALPAIAPSFARDRTVAAANPQGHDFVYRVGSVVPVAGSGGRLTDLEFMYAPEFPSGGRYAPALLSASDPHSGLPVIERCSAGLSCSGATSLPGSGSFSAPATLIPSTDYGNDGVVFAQTGRGIYKSTDGGAAFSLLTLVPSNGASATATPMLALASGYREAGPVRTAYAAVFQVFTNLKNPYSAGGVYQTTDGGASWHPLGSPSPLDSGVMAVAVAPDGRLFAGYLGEANNAASGGLLCSQNGGRTWQASCSPVGGGTASSAGSSRGTCSGAACSAAEHGTPTQAASLQGTSTSASSQRGTASLLGSADPSHGGTGVAIALGVSAFLILLLSACGAYVVSYLRRRARCAPRP